MVLDNDTRGWIMTCVSGIACVVGASIICIDLFIQRIPGQGHFRIQDSNAFLASSLSLSFGVMLFSSLYSMLPSAQRYLNNAGIAGHLAGYITIGCFLGGVLGIQVISNILHRYIPSHIVDCDHTHDDEDQQGHDHGHGDMDGYDGDQELADCEEDHAKGHGLKEPSSTAKAQPLETTPLLARQDPDLKPIVEQLPAVIPEEEPLRVETGFFETAPTSRRPSLRPRLSTRLTTFMTGVKTSCDQGGPCYGYGEPCGQECLKLASRSPTRVFGRFSSSAMSRRPSLLRTETTPHLRPVHSRVQTADEESLTHIQPRPSVGDRQLTTLSQASTRPHFRGRRGRVTMHEPHSQASQANGGEPSHKLHDDSSDASSDTSSQREALHHHHVPSNAFLAIGLQTSIAIALHKLPEGFITYATNHANPKLGFTVFMALFIHNITEGFAMALPLYLAINSRWQAMLWSSLLGGASQPLGAGVAALWFKLAGGGDMKPGDLVYGCMFSITAGIMASVALQLFSESLTLTHNRNLCTAFAFIGMGILGVSFALTA